MKKIFFTEEQTKEIINLYNNKLMNSHDIGKIFNCDARPILRILRLNGVNTSNSYRAKILYSSGKTKCSRKLNLDNKKICDLYKQRKSSNEIAKLFNCSRPTIINILKENNIPIFQAGFFGRNHTPKNKINLNEKEVIDLYGKLSSRQIAEKMGCSFFVILKILKKNNIKRLGAEFFNKRKNPKREKFNDEEKSKIVEDYLKNKITVGELSKKFNCSASLCDRIFKERNIKVFSPQFFIKRKFNEKLQKNKEEILRLYKQGDNIVEINKKLNISDRFISSLLKENGIYVKKGGDYNRNKQGWRKIIFIEEEKEKIKNLYLKGWSPVKIGKTFNCSSPPIANLLKKERMFLGNSTRRKYLFKKEILKPHNKSKIDEAELIDLYKNKKVCINALAEKYKADPDSIKKVLIKNSIDIDPIGFRDLSGDKNGMWCGGIQYEPYDFKFNNSFKDFIRTRDGFLCSKCGMRQEDSLILFKRKLICHHANYDKKLTVPENVCCLCLRCNFEVNANRNHWAKFFQSLLSERYGYKYNENQEIIIEV